MTSARARAFTWVKVLPGRKVGLFLCLFAEASVVFWHSVKEVGLLDEVVEEFQNQLQEVLKGLHERVCDPPLQVKGQEHRTSPEQMPSKAPPGPLANQLSCVFISST